MESSYFARLSPELRNEIYERVFTSSRSRKSLGPRPGLLDAQHPLTRTCRQIRSESLHMSYAATCFSAHLDDGPIAPLATWFQSIGRDAILLIREVEVFDLHDSQLVLWSPAEAERKAAEESVYYNIEYRDLATDWLPHCMQFRGFASGVVSYVRTLQGMLESLGLQMKMRWGSYRGVDGEEYAGYSLRFVITEAMENDGLKKQDLEM